MTLYDDAELQERLTRLEKRVAFLFERVPRIELVGGYAELNHDTLHWHVYGNVSASADEALELFSTELFGTESESVPYLQLRLDAHRAANRRTP